ncbi:MAG: FtsQ-type POTRA domain-containing protein [Nitrospirota bacterium]
MKANRFKRGKGWLGMVRLGRNTAALASIIAAAILLSAIIYAYPANSLFPVKYFKFTGNRHLADDELRALIDVQMNDSLVLVPADKITGQLLRSPWIKTVSLRREFPDTLTMDIRESEPFALLDMCDHLYLIDENGDVLDELGDGSVPFLPIIAGDPQKNKAGFSEAMKLVRLMHGRGLSADRDHIEVIAHKQEEIGLSMDGTYFKLGAGGYEEKLERLLQIEEDIKEMGLLVDYIDLRFEKKAIVKPVTEKVME